MFICSFINFCLAAGTPCSQNPSDNINLVIHLCVFVPPNCSPVLADKTALLF
uniref:Uncharacterized protein n=1 Tax=Scleropages formosus TaxID=113540 RepID=A0A8C9RM28_SCLFO